MKRTATTQRNLAGLAGIALASTIVAAVAIFPSAPSPRRDARASPEPAPPPLAAPDPLQVQAAVDKGLAWLRRTQDATGAWIQDVGYKRGSDYVLTQTAKAHVGVTALALMAFLSGGHLPGRGDYGEAVARGTDYVISCVDPESGFITGNETRMYSHAFATLFLGEIYGMTHREDVKEKLQLAVDLIVKSQNAQGSWRYQPFSPAADMSVTVCQIMALRAARNVGIRVPRSTIDRAHDYVDRSAEKRKSSGEYGGFRYKLDEQGRRNRTTFPLTAAGVATLNHSGIYDHDLVRAGIHFLKGELADFNRSFRGHYFYWYGHYYAGQVFFLSSDGDDDALWQWYWPQISRDLLSFQDADGSWPNDTGPGRAFGTAVACIVLQIPTQYLPIFHR